jgi:hypothetical protein
MSIERPSKSGWHSKSEQRECLSEKRLFMVRNLLPKSSLGKRISSERSPFPRASGRIHQKWSRAIIWQFCQISCLAGEATPENVLILMSQEKEMRSRQFMRQRLVAMKPAKSWHFIWQSRQQSSQMTFTANNEH